MKNGKRLTVAERKYFEQTTKLSSENWLISRKANGLWMFVHKLTGQVKEVPAP